MCSRAATRPAVGVRCGRLHDRAPGHHRPGVGAARPPPGSRARPAGAPLTRPAPAPPPDRAAGQQHQAGPGRRVASPDSTDASAPPTADGGEEQAEDPGEPPNLSWLTTGNTATGMASRVAQRSASSAPAHRPGPHREPEPVGDRAQRRRRRPACRSPGQPGDPDQRGGERDGVDDEAGGRARIRGDAARPRPGRAASRAGTRGG